MRTSSNRSSTMSNETWEETVSAGSEAAVEACWTQWAALGAGAVPTAPRTVGSLVDPEALITASLAFQGHERRLLDLVGWWAATGSRLTSLQRMKSVCDAFPEEAGSEALSLYGRLALDAGDRRWKRHAADEAPSQLREGKGPDELRLSDPASLWLRLRAGLGVGAKADVLAFLLGQRGAMATVSEIAEATGYTTLTARNAAVDMVLGRLIREQEGRPTQFFAPARPWHELLDLRREETGDSSLEALPRWRSWASLLAFLTHVDRWWQRTGARQEPSERVLASEARDLVEEHKRAFTLNGISVPAFGDYRGPEFQDAFRETIDAVADRIRKEG